MEIERKFLVKHLPNLDLIPHKDIAQAYISTDPVIRLRKMSHDYFLTIKSQGAISREEFEIAITEDQYTNLLTKAEIPPLEKKRYFIPLEDGLTAELDIYFKKLNGLMTVEVEFESLEAAGNFIPPDWFGKDVSEDPLYKNNNLIKYGIPKSYRG